MNQIGCPAGWATDHVLFYTNPELSCDMNVVLWILLGISACGMKFVVAMFHSLLWLRRNRKMRERKGNKSASTRLSIVPVLTWILLVNYILVFIISGTNVGTPSNGVNAFFYGAGWTVFGLISLLYLLKFIRLGHRIAPRPGKGLHGSASDSSSSGAGGVNPPPMIMTPENQTTLGSFDNTAKIHFTFGIVALIGQAFILCVVAIILPGDYLIIRIAAGFHAWFVFQMLVGLFHHCDRVKHAILATSKANAAQVSPRSTTELQKVVRRLRMQQAFLVATTIPAITTYCLVTAGVIPMTYYIVFIAIFMDSLMTMGTVISNVLGTRRRRPQTKNVVDHPDGGPSQLNSRPGESRNAREDQVETGQRGVSRVLSIRSETESDYNSSFVSPQAVHETPGTFSEETFPSKVEVVNSE